VANGVVYVSACNEHLDAFNMQTGVRLWTAVTAGYGYLDSSPAVADGMVYVGSDGGNLYAYGLPAAAQVKAPARPNPASLQPNLHLQPAK
jgi:hypothetical protein